MTDLDASTARDEDVWFASAGTRLFAALRGSGRPLVLLHGGLATHVSCLRMAAPLLPRYRVIAPDLRGSGASHDGRPLSYDQLADDLAALLDHVGLARAAIGGFSFGAACAVAFALRHPSRVAALAIMMPAFAGADAPPNEAQRAAFAAMASAGTRTLREGPGALLPLFDALPAEIRERARALVATFDPASVAATTAFLASAAHPFARASEPLRSLRPRSSCPAKMRPTPARSRSPTPRTSPVRAWSTPALRITPAFSTSSLPTCTPSNALRRPPVHAFRGVRAPGDPPAQVARKPGHREDS